MASQLDEDLRDLWEWLEVEEAWALQMELMNPAGKAKVFVDPSAENILKAMYMPAMSYLGYRAAILVSGEPGVGFLARTHAKFHTYKGFMIVTGKQTPWPYQLDS